MKHYFLGKQLIAPTKFRKRVKSPLAEAIKPLPERRYSLGLESQIETRSAVQSSAKGR